MKTEKNHPTPDKILAFLAQNEPSSKWQIAKALGLSYGNTYATIKDLFLDDLIKIAETRASGRNKKIDVEYYGLTLSGCLITLAIIGMKPENKALIVSVIEKQSELHPLFAKWRTLMQQVSEIELFSSLAIAAGQKYVAWKFYDNKAQERRSEDLTYYLTGEILSHVLEKSHISPQSLDRWLEAIRQDKELKRYVETRVKESATKAREKLEYYEELLRKLD